MEDRYLDELVEVEAAELAAMAPAERDAELAELAEMDTVQADVAAEVDRWLSLSPADRAAWRARMFEAVADHPDPLR